VQTATLNNGVEMPILGFGVYQIPAYETEKAQVVLRWLIQRNVAVIPKTVRPERMAENLDVFRFGLADDMARIATLDTGASLFFAHWDPQIVSQLGNVRVD
jgi:2,5-diketo-D-gluconate reductase A